MTKEQKTKLLRKAKKVLRDNWIELSATQGFTLPAKGIYPYEWNWDSAFAAYGYSHFEIGRAITEMRTLFSGQWKNGMLPHIIFHKNRADIKKEYFPGPKHWGAYRVNKNASKNPMTSGITQPPLHAMAIWHIYRVLKNVDTLRAKQLLEDFYPKLYDLSKYYMTHRDPEKWGFVTIYHPWESGLDNSPRWDVPLMAVVPKKFKARARRDILHVDPQFRPTDKHYTLYHTLMRDLRARRYDDARIYKDYPFRVKDILFSSILYLANKRLTFMAKELKQPTKEIDVWLSRFEKNLYKRFWSQKDKLFYDYDLIKKKRIRVKTIASFFPVVTGILNKERLNDILDILEHSSYCGQGICHVQLVPSLGIKEEEFNPRNYWRGPVWLNMNWFLWKGLGYYKSKRAKDLARLYGDEILRLLDQKGFYEYYSPLSGQGIGAASFSWSASLAIDIIREGEDGL